MIPVLWIAVGAVGVVAFFLAGAAIGYMKNTILHGNRKSFSNYKNKYV